MTESLKCKGLFCPDMADRLRTTMGSQEHTVFSTNETHDSLCNVQAVQINTFLTLIDYCLLLCDAHVV
jgi:hypothetical protein